MTKIFNKQLLEQSFFITFGYSIYTFSPDAINIPNKLADGGISGIVLLPRYWFHISPGLSTLPLDIPLIIIGYRSMGKRLLALTIWGTLCLSLFLPFWLYIPIINQLNLEHDPFIAGVLVRLFSSFGVGIVLKYGGTTGGTDTITRISDLKLDTPAGRSPLVLDASVLAISLTYLDIKHMVYTLSTSFVLSRTMDSIQADAHAARELFIISDEYEQIVKMIDVQLDRGYTLLNVEGGYDRSDKKMIYRAVSPREISQARELILCEDPNAFVSVVDVHEVLG